MFVRLWYINVSPEHVNDIRQVYRNEIIPTVKHFKGHMESDLLEPVNGSDEFIAMSVWRRQSDALVYESSDNYNEQRTKVVRLARKMPVLKTYTYEPANMETLVY